MSVRVLCTCSDALAGNAACMLLQSYLLSSAAAALQELYKGVVESMRVSIVDALQQLVQEMLQL